MEKEAAVGEEIGIGLAAETHGSSAKSLCEEKRDRFSLRKVFVPLCPHDPHCSCSVWSRFKLPSCVLLGCTQRAAEFTQSQTLRSLPLPLGM